MLFAWLVPIAPTSPEISLDLPPPPDPLGPLAPILGVLAVLLIVTVILRRLLRGRRGADTVFAFSVGLGNALMEVGAMLQPDRPKVTVSSEKNMPSSREDANVGDAKPPPESGERQSKYESLAAQARTPGHGRAPKVRGQHSSPGL